MRSFPLLAIAGPAILAGCVPAPSTPPPAAAPRSAPAPAPAAPRPTPTLSADWRDWPLTAGDWRYRAEPGGGGGASFGVAGSLPVLRLRCDRVTRRVTIVRTGTTASTLTLRTTSAVRAMPAVPDAPGTIALSIAANDSFLDAIGYSRGRFVIEGGGLPTLVIPAWPEILRVVEDCRK
ncbi:hypothetical protein [Sphingomonas sp. R1]|uniref:hypothetical protein n=1 Tax=Sphingomonas sp. R1 TaxID=399176 RepID=UPI0022246E86|nr:hypothetical protein [Sphingomonas sp. R1]UYY75886.1 hypothetical protein OIM94_10090 [Sphingomonas sp. R1]